MKNLNEIKHQQSDGIQILINHLVLSKATALARAGQLEQAHNFVLDMIGEKDFTPSILDLLARIYAQQGKLNDAEICWMKASELDPNNPTYIAGLERIARIRKNSFTPFRFSGILTTVIIIVVAILIYKLFLTNYSDQVNTLETKVTSVDKKIEDINSQLSQIESQDQVSEAAVSASTDSISDKINIDGITVKSEKGMTIVTFDSGLFSFHANLKPEAENLIAALGKALEPYAEDISICVVGHTNDLPVAPGRAYRDNTSLGLARALKVIEVFRSTTTLPAGIFSVKASDESQAPYPNDTDENRAKNRTVILQISKAE
jgi:flagellar motor protein MotB